MLAATLTGLAQDCIRAGAEAILIGGGPLAAAAPAVAAALPVPVIEPVAAGARLLAARMAAASPRQA